MTDGYCLITFCKTRGPIRGAAFPICERHWELMYKEEEPEE